MHLESTNLIQDIFIKKKESSWIWIKTQSRALSEGGCTNGR